jgi:tetratricopeptide (TPR) repeat protein
VGDDELAGALASHYVAAHDASDEGPEADAIAAQARLALAGAADRAAALGAHHQAVSHLQRALDLTAAPSDRAPLLDRAAVSAAAAAMEEAAAYAEQAVAAYRELADPIATAHASARLGRTLIDASRVLDASAVLESAAPAAEALVDADPSAAAAIHAQLSRCLMRLGKAAESVDAADRALMVAERLDLEPLVAEALINKGSSMVQLGRRREAAALMLKAIDLAEKFGDSAMRIRARNNYASALDDDPVTATRVVTEAMELAADIGDRGMYFWLLGNLAAALKSAGRDWDEHLVLMREALEQAVLVNDRIRLVVLTNLIESQRGEHIDEARAAVDELATETTSPDAQFGRLMLWADSSLARGEFDASYRYAMEASKIDLQAPEIPLATAYYASVGAHDSQRIRDVVRLIGELPMSGPVVAAARQLGRASVAAVEGRPNEAIPLFRAGFDAFNALDYAFDAAIMMVGALELLPHESEIRFLAERGRPMLIELRARPWLERLDRALDRADTPAVSDPSVVDTGARTAG